MPTICPNCLRPVRTNAKYCGFCGTSLISAAEVESVTAPALQNETELNLNSKQKKPPKSNQGKTSQVVTIIAFILLFLVIILALIVSHWSDISPLLGQILSLVNIR